MAETPNVPLGPQPRDFNEHLASFDSVPLFMKSLPEDAVDDPIISALQSLAHEGTPDEVAQNFKEQGNDYFKGKRYREALGFYTQGIEANPTGPALLEALLCNRAACNLELKNYGSVLKDGSRAIELNPKSSKAYYRSALALLALDHLDEAIDCCDHCLAFDKENASIKSVREKAAKTKEAREKKERERQERLQKEKLMKQRLNAALQERSIIVIPRSESSEQPYEPYFDPEDPTGKTLIMPVLFLYPQYATSDVIPNFVEDTPFLAHLANMFPPEAAAPDWDKKQEYMNGRLSVYAVTHRKRLLKVGKNMTLRDVCDNAREKPGQPKDGLELKDGCLTFAVLPRGDVETKWIEDFKKLRDGS